MSILRNVKGSTTAKHGCLACEFYKESTNDQHILYLEQWDTASAIHQHIQSPMFALILNVMNMSTMQPEILFYETTRSWGLELVEKLRISNELNL